MAGPVARLDTDTLPTLPAERLPQPRERSVPRERTFFSCLPPKVWVAVLLLYGILAVLEPYDLLSPISGYGLQEHKGEIAVALDTIEGGSPLRRLGVVALFLYGAAAVYLSRRTRRRYHHAIAVPAIALFVLALASPLWSQDPGITVRKAFVLCSLVLAAYGLSRSWNLETLVRVTLLFSGMTILLGVATEVALGTIHPLSSDFRFRGSIHPNSMALYCSLFVISAVLLAKRFTGRRAALMVVLSVIGLGMLLLTKSRGSLVGLSAALAVVFVWSAQRRTTLLAASGVVIAVSSAMILFPDLGEHAESWATLGRSTTFDLADMTGRTELFRGLLPYVADRPLLGYGYDSFWEPVHILEVAKSQGWIVGSSHNQVIGMLLDLGVLGCALFVTLLVASLWIAVVNARRDRAAVALFPVAVLVWSYVNMITFGFWLETTVPSFIALTVVGRLAIRDATRMGSRVR
jgi:exopolysaccharide production protein ExoQ